MVFHAEIRTGSRRAIRATSKGVAVALVLNSFLGAAVNAETNRAGENEILFRAVGDLCIDHSGTVDAAAARALKMPFEAFNYGSEKQGFYGRQIGLKKLGSGGTVVTFSARTKQSPMNECHFASYSDDVADMAQRLRAAFALSEPVSQPYSVQLASHGEKALAGRLMKFKLEHGFGPDQRSGSFSLTVNR